MSTSFLILKNILAELKRKNSITVLEKHCQEKWEIYDLFMDLTNDENFKQAYIDLSFNKSFKKDFIELANQAKKAVSKYFERKDIELQAFYNDANKVLNINLINYNRSEPIRISDILQQERDISALNIYCDKKHGMYAYRKDKERHYEFKEDAYYEMTSTWSVQDNHGKTFTCTMVMNVSSVGITEVLQFNSKDFESPSKEFWNLIRQNEELYIQGLSLHDAVKTLLEKNKDAPAVSNLQNIVINQDEKLKDLENDAKNNPILSFTSNNVPAQQIATQAIATQTEVNSQHTETQTEVAVQHVEIQAEIGSQQAETQTEVGLQEVAIQTGISLQHTEAQTEVTVQHVETQTEIDLQKVAIQVGISSQETETQTEVNLQEIAIQNLQEAAVQTEINSQQLDQKFTKAEQEIEELEKCNSDLQNALEEEKQKNVKLQIGLTQKDEKLKNISTELQGKIQELESVHEGKEDLEKKLTITNAEREKLKSKVNQLEEDANENEKEVDRMRYEYDKSLTNLKSQMRSLDDEHNTNLESSKQEVDRLKRKCEELENELELKDEQIKKYKQQLSQKREETKENQLLQSKIKELEKCNKYLTEMIGNKALEIERITGERKELNGKVQYLNSQVELLSPVIDQVLVNKKKVFDDNSKMFYQLTEEIDDSEKKPRSLSLDSAFHSDDDDHCSSLLDLISSPSKVCSQSQRGNS